MSNLRLVGRNLAINASLSSSNHQGNLVADNLKTSGRSKVLRSSGTSVTITASFSSSIVSCISLPMCNLSSTATLTISCGGVSRTVTCCAYSMQDHVNFSGTPDANSFAVGGGSYATVFFNEVLASSATITITDSANAAGYIDIAYLVIGRYFSPVYNANLGASIRFSDSTNKIKNDVGDPKLNRGSRHRILSFTLEYMPASDRKQVVDALVFAGTSSPVFCHLFPESEDDQERQVYQVYGYLSKMGGIRRQVPLHDNYSFELEEL